MIESSYHYQVIARAMRHLDASGDKELSLAEIAEQMGMSPAHFQRLFSQWVGVSPKRYQQYLSLRHARCLLRAGSTVLETASATGRSGSGRLHDLFVRWEAMSPGDYAKKGKDLTIWWDWFDSPFGDMLAMGTARGLCGVAFAVEFGRQAALADLSARWPDADFIHDSEAIREWVDAALNRNGEARVLAIGAPFQIKVWEALISIPSGQVSTYSAVARTSGFPNAVRAVGTAVGRNPVSWLIPCHRVVRKSGGLGGYHWGLPVKRAMLAWEAARTDAFASGHPAPSGPVTAMQEATDPGGT